MQARLNQLMLLTRSELAIQKLTVGQDIMDRIGIVSWIDILSWADCACTCSISWT
jgi:hypothetical protein